jgi:hypothetical protein
MSEVRDKLQAELATASWELLQPHYERDALFVVDGALDLVDVGVAVAEDRTSEVQGWIEAGQLVRPTAEQAGHWSEHGGTFQFLIVQPFVLVQPVAG